MPNTFDVDAIIEELELDREDIVELLTDFREFLEGTMPKLEAALAGGDLSESRSLSHSIKGSAGNLRVNAVYITAKSMKDVADAGDLEQLKTLFIQLQGEVEAFLEESQTFS